MAINRGLITITDSLESTSTVQFRIWYHFYRGHRFYMDNFFMNVGEEERTALNMDHVDFSKDFVMTGSRMDVSADSLRTYYTSWDQYESTYEVDNWTIEGHAPKDEGAYFLGDYNEYHMSHITSIQTTGHEQGMDFNDIDYSVLTLTM